MNNPETWYIVKRPLGHCEIFPSDQPAGDNDPAIVERWGPFTSQHEAFARRIGLIRAGLCQPV